MWPGFTGRSMEELKVKNDRKNEDFAEPPPASDSKEHG